MKKNDGKQSRTREERTLLASTPKPVAHPGHPILR
ncbi:MAG: hypothetical protein QOC61_133, partial [Acidobacteriota bacterium]|nr:hypothetical protein [Acidobacteriota bacterium]